MERVNFQQPRRLFSDYLRRFDPPSLEVVEVRERLRQLDWVLDRVYDLQGRYEALSRQGDGDSVGAMLELGDEFEVFTEAFYLFAWRLRLVVKQLPSCRSFECKPIRDIRNLLIVHPEKPGGVLRRSVSFGDEVGPQLKPAVLEPPSKSRLFDRGLFVNASEFRDQLMTAFQRLLT